MMYSEFTCPDGRDVSELLAYVEGELDASSRRSLEKHLMSCRACSGEVASLRRMAHLLRDYPESLHPDEVELHRYVYSGEDPGSHIASHVAWCEDCNQDVRMLEEMLLLKDELPDHRQPLPKSLIRRLEEVHSVRGDRPGLLKSLSAFLRGLVSQPFRAPVLALGTAAAVLIIAVVSIPMWQSYKEAIVPAPTATPEQAVRTTKIAEPPSKREELSEDESGTAPASVREDTRDKRLPASEAPVVPGSPSEGTRVAPGEIPTGSRPESTSSEKPRMRGAGVFRGREVAPKFSAQEPMPAAPEKGVVKARQAPALGMMRHREARTDTISVPATVTGRGPVRIRIVDRDGRVIPWLRFEAPDNMAAGMRFDDTEEASHQMRSRIESDPSKAKPHPFEKKETGRPLVLIHVGMSKDLYDITAELFEYGSDRATKTIEASGINRGDLEKRLKSIVSSLLGAR